jgi:hypothetical protein
MYEIAITHCQFFVERISPIISSWSSRQSFNHVIWFAFVNLDLSLLMFMIQYCRRLYWCTWLIMPMADEREFFKMIPCWRHVIAAPHCTTIDLLWLLIRMPGHVVLWVTGTVYLQYINKNLWFCKKLLFFKVNIVTPSNTYGQTIFLSHNILLNKI